MSFMASPEVDECASSMITANRLPATDPACSAITGNFCNVVMMIRAVLPASDARSCLDQVQATRPDLLILDVNMPGGGPHVAAAAKALYPDLHIVVFSGRVDPAIRHAMLAAGADQFVLKTGRVQPLLEAMETAYHQLTT